MATPSTWRRVADAVSYDLRDKVALLTIDDGKANAISSSVISGIHEGLDRLRRFLGESRRNTARR